MSIDWSYPFKELESGPIIKAYEELHVGPIVSARRRDVDGRLLLVPRQNPDLDAGSAESHQRLFHALLKWQKSRSDSFSHFDYFGDRFKMAQQHKKI